MLGKAVEAVDCVGSRVPVPYSIRMADLGLGLGPVYPPLARI